jgi:hypothetical protein
MSFAFVVLESFLDPDLAAEIWPKNISADKSFSEQLMQRKELNEHLKDVIDRLPRPDISLESAINQGYISEEQVAKLYASLSILLESDQAYGRIILYLPFEFLPNKTWRPLNENLRQSSGRFILAHMKAWKELLCMHDVRANFVDGDILEAEQRVGDLPRVVKAAHLIPVLVKKGLLGINDVMALIEENDDQVLRDSIVDSIPVLADMGLIAEKEIGFKKRIRSDIQKESGEITKKRKIWLEQREKQRTIEVSAKDISAAVLENRLMKQDTTNRQALVEGIRKAIESVAKTDPIKARALYKQYRQELLELWENNDQDIKEALLKTFRRLHHLNIINGAQLTELDIAIPKLEAPFSENLELIKGEMDDIKNMANTIESNPELSQLIYPAVLVYGSRLKGYGAQNADIDLAVFVKPKTSFSKRILLQRLLKKTFAHEKIKGGITEFWLKEKEGKLCIRDFNNPDVLLGESYWAHVLFGAAWLGNKSTISELCEKLLATYMHDNGKLIYGRNARNVYLEEMERDNLQYRLMHKGYEQFFPQCGGLNTPHADEIDGKSMFWDSGYRQLATRLFVNRVFLPKIPIDKN